jgi:predicted Zn-dependent protease
MSVRRIIGHRITIAVVVVAALAVGAWMSWRWWTGRFLRQAEEAMAARSYDKAKAQLATYLSHRPGDAHARLLAARAARRLRDYDEAADHLRRCRENGGLEEAIDVEYALIALQRGDAGPDEALRRRANQDDALALVILEALIQYDIDTYQLRQAQHDLDLYLSRRPDDLHALLSRAYVWERFQSFADALADYRKAVAAHPRDDRARLRLADTLLIVGTPEEALEQYQVLAERWPKKIEVRFGIARCKRRLGRIEEAGRELEAIVSEGPDNGEVLWERGLVALDRRRPEEAEPWLRRAAKVRPHDRRICYGLSRCLLELDKREEAQAWSARAEQLDADLRRLHQVCQEVMQRPNDAALRCEGGLLFLRNGEQPEGLRWLRLALQLDPDCSAAREALSAAAAGLRPDDDRGVP